ncbi:hypothetical protein [Pantoea ananatis]|uniref:hypothetical protein n=1 Tax=Pantoea ananas TaxID=553 RepID=UPI0025CA7EEE|nr:hypothetical protein [Pantoea ananatis]MDN4128258.1 hypothetical protein [Pantoea ananatis]MDN4152558.1 hypothetical protein [Pantoea ananatis]
MKNQFSIMSGKELVAAGHQFAKSLDADAPLIEIAKMFSEMASRLDCAIARGDELQQKLDAVAAESDTNLSSAASELNTSWMLHKTMMGAQAALLCLSQGDILSAKEWLEGTTDEAIIEMPDDLNPRDLQAWFDSNMVSNGGSNGFLTHSEALELLRKRAPATAAYMDSVRAEGVRMFASAVQGGCAVGDRVKDLASEFADSLRSGTHETADKAAKV